ncbi:MAG: FAD/NAD(P)-binding protein [Thermodesulfobacteriota bacterium]|nr:FAD/NAD(P)-binding protein [Thermodesulfobacteriota bacterium]
MNNPYLPHTAKIVSVRDEAFGERPIKTFRVVPENSYNLNHRPGQCAIIGILGIGESMISIASSPTKKDFLEFSIMRLGKVTSALHECEEDDTISIRGPYGNGFPLDDWKGKDIVTIGGGIGQAPLRPIIQYILDNRSDFGKLDVIYGARTSQDLCFKDELLDLGKGSDAEVHLSVDVEEPGWSHFVGFVPTNLLEVKPSSKNTVAITCGPVVMIKYVIKNLLELGFSEQQIFTTMENRMKCGIGKCGRCNVGNLYVCKDGPVFCYDTLKDLPEF